MTRPCPSCIDGKVAMASLLGEPCRCYSPHVCACRQREELCERCGGSGYICADCGYVPATKEQPICAACRTCYEHPEGWP